MTSTIGRRMIPSRRISLAAAVISICMGLCCLADAALAAVPSPQEAPGDGTDIALLAGASGSVPGMDVSSYQGNVDWPSAYRAGARFAYVKATEGTGYTNPYFAQQYNGSYQAGMVRGAYHFALPDASPATTQADFFVAHGGSWSNDGRTMPPMLDIEYNPYGAECFGLSASQMVAWIKDFSDEVHAKTSRWPMIYTTTDWWQACTGNLGDFSSTNPLFVARYANSAGPMPYKWEYYTLWQFSDSGAFPGDQDQFNGTIDRLRALVGQPPAPAPSPAPATGRTTTAPPRSTSSTPPSTATPHGTTSKPAPPARSTSPTTSGSTRTVPGLVWAGGATPPAPPRAIQAPGRLAVVPNPPPHAAAQAPATTTSHRAAPSSTTSHPTSTPPTTSRTQVVAAAPATTPATPPRVLASTGSRPIRPALFGVCLVLLGVCLLLIRRETAPRVIRVH